MMIAKVERSKMILFKGIMARLNDERKAYQTSTSQSIFPNRVMKSNELMTNISLESPTCLSLDRLVTLYRLEISILCATYALFREYRKSYANYIESMRLCNAKQPAARCELFTAFRLMLKFLKDIIHWEMIKNIQHAFLPMQPRSWEKLEMELLKEVNYNLYIHAMQGCVLWKAYQKKGNKFDGMDLIEFDSSGG